MIVKVSNGGPWYIGSNVAILSNLQKENCKNVFKRVSESFSVSSPFSFSRSLIQDLTFVLLLAYQQNAFGFSLNITYQLSQRMTKPTKWHVCSVKTLISLGICPVWLESSLSTWRKLRSLAIQWAHSEYSDLIWRTPRLIWVFRWAHTPFCWFCHALAQLSISMYLSHLEQGLFWIRIVSRLWDI